MERQDNAPARESGLGSKLAPCHQHNRNKPITHPLECDWRASSIASDTWSCLCMYMYSYVVAATPSNSLSAHTFPYRAFRWEDLTICHVVMYVHTYIHTCTLGYQAVCDEAYKAAHMPPEWAFWIPRLWAQLCVSGAVFEEVLLVVYMKMWTDHQSYVHWVWQLITQPRQLRIAQL